MLLAKKTPVMIVPARISRKNLEHLYARRSAIDALIQSLEEYDRFRERRSGEDTRKTA
ncbi:MAG TPA: hypothetical protein VGZ73_27385 [Bryobacteraceae bacterium]|jgi:hypothetical protein|nr:hypothetical protein [Bryobacteraceae bacterium]